MANNDINTSRELVVVYDWQSVRNIWEAFQKGKIGMAERDKALAPYRNKLHSSMLLKSTNPQLHIKRSRLND